MWFRWIRARLIMVPLIKVRLSMLRRSFLVLLLAFPGCSAQSPSASSAAAPAPTSDITRTIEREVRAHYSLPPEVKVVLGPLRSSEFPNYDALPVTFARPNQKQDFRSEERRVGKEC